MLRTRLHATSMNAIPISSYNGMNSLDGSSALNDIMIEDKEENRAKVVATELLGGGNDIYAPKPLTIYGDAIKIVDHIKLPVHDNLLHELFDDKYKKWWKRDDISNSADYVPARSSHYYEEDDAEDHGEEQNISNIFLSSTTTAVTKPKNSGTILAASFSPLEKPIPPFSASSYLVENVNDLVRMLPFVSKNITTTTTTITTTGSSNSSSSSSSSSGHTSKVTSILSEEGDKKETANLTPSSYYYDQQWQNRFKELCEFRSHHGHCLVPYHYKENPSLGEWVKRQRYHFRMRKKNKKTILTDERIAMLDKIGFVWDSHDSAWNVRFVELCAFMKDNGHFNVPAKSSKNYKQLANWASRQRRLKKLHLEGAVMNERDLMRIQKLESIGFFM